MSARESKGADLATIAAGTGIPEERVAEYLAEFQAAGLVEQHGERWRVSSRGLFAFVASHPDIDRLLTRGLREE
jgi:DNA-binding IclR family transcriptional regulator